MSSDKCRLTKAFRRGRRENVLEGYAEMKSGKKGKRNLQEKADADASPSIRRERTWNRPNIGRTSAEAGKDRVLVVLGSDPSKCPTALKTSRGLSIWT